MPTWTLPRQPDGQRLAFESRFMNSSGITHRRQPDGRAPRDHRWPGDVVVPPARRHGHRTAVGLAFYHQSDVFTAQADGSDRRLIARGAFDPAWSPDGDRIAYVRFDRSGGSVVVANADGTDAHALTSSPRQESEPAWSPDGRRIAFVRSRGSENRKKKWIVIASSDTGKPLATITSAHSLVSPAWRAPAALPRALPKNCR